MIWVVNRPLRKIRNNIKKIYIKNNKKNLKNYNIIGELLKEKLDFVIGSVTSSHHQIDGF